MLSDFLVLNDTPERSDMIFVLAGRPERKAYGLQLYRQGLAPRLILSVGRYEVRQPSYLGLACAPRVVELARATPPEQRHFFIDMRAGSEQVVAAGLQPRGTFPELYRLADYVAGAANHSIALVSTGIHLRRVRFCCQRIPFFSDKQVYYVPVPDAMSSFPRKWWTDRKGWRYLMSEYVKLAGYSLKYPRD
jgi:hypothetical protein